MHPLTIDTALWALLALTWLAAFPFTRKTVKREPLASRLRYLFPAVIGGALLSPALPTLGARVIPDAPSAGALSVAITALGIAFAIWARFALGKNWSGTVTVKAEHTLVRRGPYAIVRHPIYTGFLTAFIGTALAVGTPRALLAVVPLAFALWQKSAVEEGFMREHFGADYADYRARVKRLVPFVW